MATTQKHSNEEEWFLVLKDQQNHCSFDSENRAVSLVGENVYLKSDKMPTYNIKL